MLILRRKAGESLLIGDEVKITILDVYEGGVRLAIDAPRKISVLRSELVQAAEANRDAAGEPAQQPQQLLKMLERRGQENPKAKEQT